MTRLALLLTAIIRPDPRLPLLDRKGFPLILGEARTNLHLLFAEFRIDILIVGSGDFQLMHLHRIIPVVRAGDNRKSFPARARNDLSDRSEFRALAALDFFSN